MTTGCPIIGRALHFARAHQKQSMDTEIHRWVPVFDDDYEALGELERRHSSVPVSHGFICLRGFWIIRWMVAQVNLTYHRRLAGRRFQPVLQTMSWGGLTQLKMDLAPLMDDLKMAQAEYDLLGVHRTGQSGLSMPSNVVNGEVIAQTCLIDVRLVGMLRELDGAITIFRPYLGNTDSSVGRLGQHLGDFCREQNDMTAIQTLLQCVRELMDVRP